MKELKTNRNVGLFATLAVVSVFCNAYMVRNMFRSLGLLGLLSGDVGAILGGTLGGILSLTNIAIGIYILVLFWGVCQDINTICAKYEEENGGKKSPNYIVVLLLSAITLNIYYLYWAYKQGNRLWETAHNYYHKDIKDNGSTYLILNILGYFTGNICKFIFMGKLLGCVNRLAAAYNEDIQNGSLSKAENGTIDAGDDSMTIPMKDWDAGAKTGEGSMECCAGIYQGALFPVNEAEMIIGRDESRANIIVKNEKVSRVHCGVRYDASAGNYLVTDYSSNGTFYKNGQKFEHGIVTECRPGTILVIAQSGNEFLLR